MVFLLEVIVADRGELVQVSDEGADSVSVDTFLAKEAVNLFES